MIYKKFKELYPVDTISQEKGWVKVQTALNAINDDCIEVDFFGINVQSPWDCKTFINILKDKRVHMIFHDKHELATRIQMICVLNGAYPDNITNIEVEKPREKSAEEKKIEDQGQIIMQFFKKDGNTYVFDVKDKYTQLHSSNTMNYIKYAIDTLSDTKGAKKFIIKVGNVSTLDNVIEVLANMIIKYKAQGIDLRVDIDSPEAIKKMGLYLHKSNSKVLSADEKVKMINDKIRPGTPGLLIKYRKSRTLDDFGRYGKGEVISSRIAIFRGVVNTGKKDSEPVVLMESYNNEYFYTKQHWMVEHDNEELPALHIDKMEIDLKEFGFIDDFLGSSFHFIEPVPDDDTDTTIVITDIDDEGKNIKKKCTLPERMKIVFDDWDIEYDKELMEKYIKETAEVLGKE